MFEIVVRRIDGEVQSDIYRQVVEELDLVAMIRVVNQPPYMIVPAGKPVGPETRDYIVTCRGRLLNGVKPAEEYRRLTRASSPEEAYRLAEEAAKQDGLAGFERISVEER